MATLAPTAPSPPAAPLDAIGMPIPLAEAGMFDLLFGRGARILAGIAIAGSFVMPPDGIGFTLCLFKRATLLPCPGCGLTRSFACISHGRLLDAAHYHPFGPLLYVWACLALVATLAGPARRERAAVWLASRGRVVRALYWGAVGAFIVFGLARLGIRMWWRFHRYLG